MKDEERPVARYVKPGEFLAIDPSVLHRSDTGAFFWMMGSGLKPNECRDGGVTLVHIRGELEHHKDRWGCAESYEGILEKLCSAVTGQDAVDAHKYKHGWEADYEPLLATPPKRIISLIDSPGGVVAGLNECHTSIVKLIEANPEIKFSVYVNEMAASAAYALACAFPEIICPRSAILGSIGVISTMISQARKNKKDGYDVELLTSGARKADGHLHAPISEDAKAVEMDRVMKLAKSFWSMVSKTRGIPMTQIQGFEAGIFLGQDAARRKLADAVMSFDDVLLGAGAGDEGGAKTKGGGNETDRRLRAADKSVSITTDKAVGTEAPMLALAALIKKTEKAAARMTDAPKDRAAALGLLRALQRTDKALVGGKKLSALIEETEAAIATTTDAKALGKLIASLEAYKKTEKHIEHTKSEEGDDDEDDDSDEEEEDDEEEEAESKKSKATKPDDEEEEATKSEEEEAKAALAAVRRLTGLTGSEALGALTALAGSAAKTAADVADLKRSQRTTEKAALITGARAARQITKAEEKDLGEQPLKFVKGFLKMRQKAGFVITDEGELTKPKHVEPGTEASLPAATIEMVDAAVATWTGDKKTYREALIKAHLEAHTKQLAAAMNGAPGRY